MKETFVNELGREVTVEVVATEEYPGKADLVVRMVGPDSVSENYITAMEAAVLWRVLGAYLGKEL